MPEHTPAPMPSRGVYGFVMYLVFKALFFIYVFWALVPEHWFEHLGFPYFPQRYWVVAIPIFLLTVLAMFAFFIYPSLGLIMTPSLDDISTVEDEHSKYANDELTENLDLDTVADVPCICKYPENCKKSLFDSPDYKKQMKKNAIPPKLDVHFLEVSRNLYLRRN